MSKLGIYGGSFDPITVGHFDVVDQALEIFEQVEIAVGVNSGKKSRFFTQQEAANLIADAVVARYGHTQRVLVSTFQGTLVRYAERQNASGLIRGLRHASDFADEFVLNGANAMISPMPMTYFICRTKFIHVSSSVVRELAKLGEDFSALVPENVVNPIWERIKQS